MLSEGCLFSRSQHWLVSEYQMTIQVGGVKMRRIFVSQAILIISFMRWCWLGGFYSILNFFYSIWILDFLFCLDFLLFFAFLIFYFSLVIFFLSNGRRTIPHKVWERRLIREGELDNQILYALLSWKTLQTCIGT